MHLEVTKNHTSPIFSDNLTQSFLDLEVDLVVLSRELIKLEGFSIRIAKRLRESRQLVSELESVQAVQELT